LIYQTKTTKETFVQREVSVTVVPGVVPLSDHIIITKKGKILTNRSIIDKTFEKIWGASGVFNF